MLKFFKGLFGKKDDGGLRYHAPPAGTSVHDRNLGAVLQDFAQGDSQGLRLPGAELSEKGVAKLAALEGLRGLDLSEAKTDDTALAALRGPALERLSLRGVGVTGACFVKIGALPRLRSLDLAGTKVVDMAVLALLKSCPNLEELDLSGTPISDQAVEYLGQFKKLRRLVVKDCALDGAGLAMISHDKGLSIED
ncbi:MAG: hypothetical protein D6731_20845 [Planctomycetota bacterium]|nr:MAG: hypothetical protein D6731_20845 [Planctomycetota bacterium]